MAVRRMLPFLILNVLVSAVVVLAVLYWWEGRQEPKAVEPPPTFAAVLPFPTMAPTLVNQVEIQTLPEIIDAGPEIYSVQRGDTLGSISNKFGVPVIDIMDANGIDDPDFLQVNQELIIPEYGDESLSLEATPTEEVPLHPSPIPAQVQLEGEALLEIGAVAAPGDLAAEAVTLVNNGSLPVSLVGWKIADEDSHAYVFGQVTLFGEGAAIVVHSNSGEDGPTDLYWGAQEPIWRAGETLTLLDSEGTARASLIVTSP